MKFSIRDLLLVTVIVALVLGWAVDHNRSRHLAERANYAEQKSAALERVLERQGWGIYFGNGHVNIMKISHSTEDITNYAIPITDDPNPPRR